VFFDELVYAHDWDLWLKTFFDDRWPLRIAASSSASAALRAGRVESGVGRWDEQYLSPYLFGEYLDLAVHGPSAQLPAINVRDNLRATLSAAAASGSAAPWLAEHMQRFMLTGGFPELLLADATTSDEGRTIRSQRVLGADAVERVIYKDIAQSYRIEDPKTLERLLFTLGGQIGGILSPQSICQTVRSLSQPTFDRYLSYLERSYLVFTLANHAATESSRQRRGRKLYFVDVAVRNAALQRGLAPLSDSTELGLLRENVVASHMHALCQSAGVRGSYWREGKHEVDLVFDQPSGGVAIEIASSSSHSKAGLAAFQHAFPAFRGGCYLIYPGALTQSPESSNDGIGTLPLELALLAISRQAERAMTQRLAASITPPR
jgi:predicted AAA+ superfamily ATPase